MKTLKILTLTKDDGDYREKDIFFIDGVKIAEGSYGGQPEDNSKGRDYSWVQDAVEKIAQELGASIERQCKQVDEVEFRS